MYSLDRLLEDAARKFARCVPSAEELPLREAPDRWYSHLF